MGDDRFDGSEHLGCFYVVVGQGPRPRWTMPNDFLLSARHVAARATNRAAQIPTIITAESERLPVSRRPVRAALRDLPD
jgi:hypothetical protein